MDFNSLKDSVSNLTLYDLKAGVRKVQNAVMNFTEMEAKVREATNNEPWGASSTLMQEIANGTFNYQTLNEIMPMIYRRFTEKAAEEWRQIYKALQLLEFLIKHGSERVIDDARNHLTLLKMLRQFHYIDQNGKDQGINVRNRAKELTELLSDVDRIRAERKKARAAKNKYVGVEGGAGLGGGFSSGSNSRYGGFGSESASGGDSYGGYSGGVYGDGGGFGGQTNDYSSSSRRDKFEEYDEFDGNRPAASSSNSSSRTKRERSTPKHREEAPKPKPQKAPEVDLFSFDDPVPSSSAAPVVAPAMSSLAALSAPAAPAAAADDDDEFDDFQSATSAAPAASSGAAFGGLSMAAPTMTSPTIAAPKPVSAPQQANLGNMMSMASISPAPSSSGTPAANYSSFSIPAGTAPLASAPATTVPAPMSSGPNYFSSVQAVKPLTATSTGGGMAAIKPVMTGGAKKPAAAAGGSSGGDAFGALWSQASSNLNKKPAQTQAGPSMGQLAKEKSSAGIWGAASAGASTAGTGAKPQGGSASNDLADLLG
ncbi:hypothetical protein TD95_001098 [Thielaviopsis punctulata]|uniref:ENTH domain-containing protein n=1 Tax=Thielaviopsis punctulata TaxID=72032 RepID=A0A0F4ZK36_9PEZI|nr:hypothetical protein TD95_001098 [Thielaviopsis punctulata]